VAHTGDLGRHVEERVTDLAGHHVHFVRIGDGDHHVGAWRAGALQHVGVRGKADQTLDIQGIDDLVDQLRRLVDHGDVGVLARKIAGDARSDLACTADDDLHGALYQRSLIMTHFTAVILAASKARAARRG
jgi:hypothetical protein